MTLRSGYPGDLSDDRWTLIEPVLSAWRASRRQHALDIGRPPEHDLRQIMNAILYVDRTGIPWRYLPHDFAPWATVYGYFAKWQQDGVSNSSPACCGAWSARRRDATANRQPACWTPRPSKPPPTSTSRIRAPTPGNGSSAASVTWATDTPGLLLTVMVTAASISDTAAGVQLLSRIATAHLRFSKAWVDAGYRTTAIGHGARLGIDVQPVQCPPGTQGFTIVPRRWTIERSIGWLMHHRRPRPRLRDPPTPFRSHFPNRDDRPNEPPPHRRSHPKRARHLTCRNQTQTSGPNAQLRIA
ncbi:MULTISPECIES: IS5 family transposase [Streptomyces]|uniref:IS5 family transposase n=1 Tax=Streptomyces TaxID=1883 RepID=UPI001CCD52AD|nr:MULTISPECIES: IS5 family transposase [Streptomyces]UBI39985.1 IS5 family transposase [Streptomyces mobaraensis]UKW32565.1 IS5 family transposase [Streptomyces sp. TYQ1024]